MHSVCSLATTPFFGAKLCYLTCYALTSHPVVQNTICACGDRSDRFRWLHNRKIIVILPSVGPSAWHRHRHCIPSLPPSLLPIPVSLTVVITAAFQVPLRGVRVRRRFLLQAAIPIPLPSVMASVASVRVRPSPSSLTFCTGCLIAC